MYYNEQKSTLLLDASNIRKATMIKKLNEAFSILKLNDIYLDDDFFQLIEFDPKGTSNELILLYVVAKYCKEKKYCFSESQIFDFLSFFNRFIEVNNGNVLFPSEIIFSIYSDICNRYTSFSFELKCNLPFILYELAKIIYESFTKISTFEVKKLYNKKIKYYEKVGIINISEKYPRPTRFLTTNIDAKNEMIENQVFISILRKITSRSEHDLKVSLLKLNINDLKRIYNICINYDKIQRYEESINCKSFNKVLQKELGIVLSNNQIQRAKISVRKTKTYIDSILDGKFIRHDTHGINHVKHNLEYGFQVLKLIYSTKRDLR